VTDPANGAEYGARWPGSCLSRAAHGRMGRQAVLAEAKIAVEVLTRCYETNPIRPVIGKTRHFCETKPILPTTNLKKGGAGAPHPVSASSTN
jgi:hypothetical protein